MKVLLSGASGFLGSALIPELLAANHQVLRLVRREPGAGEVRWDPAAGRIDTAALRGCEAVIHLAGENIAARRWSAAQKRRIRFSRVDATQLLCDALAEDPPRVFVGASAIGYYGDRGDEQLTEASPPGTDFLAQVCVDWEAASEGLGGCGTRIVRLRIGVVLGLEGGALPRMLPAFKLGLGGRLGSGRQFMSWISRDDVVAVVMRALRDDGIAGVYNTTAPEPVRNLEWTKTLGRVLGRPTVLPAPALALRLLFGEMGRTLLLSSTRVLPARLQEMGFGFRHADAESALRHFLG